MLLCQALAENMLVDALSWANPDQSFPPGSSSSSYEVLSQVGKNLSHFYRWGNCGPAESVRNTPKINSDLFFVAEWRVKLRSPAMQWGYFDHHTTLLPLQAGLGDGSPNPVAPAIPQRENQCPGSALHHWNAGVRHNAHISCRKTSWSIPPPPKAWNPNIGLQRKLQGARGNHFQTALPYSSRPERSDHPLQHRSCVPCTWWSVGKELISPNSNPTRQSWPPSGSSINDL